MKKWWMGAAVAAVCVGQSARAQYPPGGGPLPDPVPVAACPAPGAPDGQQFVPGPLPASAAPPGPENGLSLPADIPTAWGRGPMPESNAYGSVGAMGLMRQRPGSAVIAQYNGVPVLTTHDIDPDYYWGYRATFGYLCDDAAIELTGFYLPQQQTSVIPLAPSPLGLFFNNGPANFVGPSGAGLLTTADTAALKLTSALGDAELNYRWWSRSFTGCEGIIGLRYMNVQEQGVVTAASLASGAAAGFTPGESIATYMGRANNNLLLAQSGFEWNLPLTKWLAFGLMAKGAIGANYITVDTRLTNGDGVVGASGKRDQWSWSSVYEFDAFFDIVEFEKVRLRLGYTAMWVTHVAEGFQQINFDLSAQPVTHDGGTIFYHGPMVELEFLF